MYSVRAVLRLVKPAHRPDGDAMMFGSRFHVQDSRLVAKISTRLLATLLVLWLCAGIAHPVNAQDLRVKAEAEGKSDSSTKTAPGKTFAM
jgi:hypothetical protein